MYYRYMSFLVGRGRMEGEDDKPALFIPLSFLVRDFPSGPWARTPSSQRWGPEFNL